MEKIAEKKKAILESTLKLVKENGFHGTPMSQVAKKAGVAAGTIYHYFDSKDTLIMELYLYTQYRVLDAMRENSREDMDYKTLFFSNWMSRCQFYIENPDALCFMEQFVNSPYNNRCSREQNERFQKEVLQFIERGIEQKYLKPMNQRLMCIMMHSTALTAAKIQLAGQVSLGEEELQQLAQMVWDGIKLN
ncbi:MULTISPECIES: TetR/AcrR family transcriptional regulator [Rufibacter]|uniref:AcrR family transcriptional regulator n=1 Tax=Rufibacter quisquiliarum TaxID=1549639 RepID=A0A839GL33_9BACT|nr:MULTISPECIES: TetR/AcrR family transcriptional regulator [Rufibacter]MBA9076295.1 AcrR family transcriptional regulator [Rufibacter quisquiliarum]